MTKPRLSASKIKTLSSCSWIFYKTYFTDFPQSSNSGSSRGSTVHYVLECLLREKRKPDSKFILEKRDVFAHPGVARLIKIHAKKLGVDDTENLKMINDFILVALENDFYCEGALSVMPEQGFDIEGPNYTITGFRDVTAIYKDKIVVRDFKCSRAKLNSEELNFNLQNIIYCMSMREQYPDMPVELIFQFLKFKRAPNQIPPPVTDDQIAGFKQYLEHIADYIKDFDKKKAVANLAKGDIKRSWMCGKIGEKDTGEVKWLCPHRLPRTYFVVKDKNGKTVKSAFSKKDLDISGKEGYSIEVKTSEGCPAFRKDYE